MLVITMILGLVIGLVGFGYCAVNLTKFEFTKFAYGMIVMAVGGLVFIVSAILGGWQIIQQFLAK